MRHFKSKSKRRLTKIIGVETTTLLEGKNKTRSISHPYITIYYKQFRYTNVYKVNHPITRKKWVDGEFLTHESENLFNTYLKLNN